MNPKEYAQILYEVIEKKTESQQDDIITRFKALLARNKDAHLAPAIEKEFAKIHQQKEWENITYIASSIKLSGAQKKEIENIFPEPREFSENPSLLGGVAVRQKDSVYNATLRKKVEFLKNK